MEEAQNISNRLLNGVNELVEELQKLRDENQQLRQQIVLLKAENEAKIARLAHSMMKLAPKKKN